MASASRAFGNSRQTHPKHQPVRGHKRQSGRFTPTQHNDLLPKHEDFCFQRRSRPKQIDDEAKYQPDENQHPAQRRPILYAAPTGFNLRQGHLSAAGSDNQMTGLRTAHANAKPFLAQNRTCSEFGALAVFVGLRQAPDSKGPRCSTRSPMFCEGVPCYKEPHELQFF